MKSARCILAIVVVALACSAASAAQPDQKKDQKYEQGGPSGTAGSGPTDGTLTSVSSMHGGSVASEAVSLEALERSPDRYDGKTLARRVAITSGLKKVQSTYSIGLKDSETGASVGPGLREGGLSFLVSPEFARRFGESFRGAESAKVTFTVVKMPAPPGETYWVGVVSRVDFLDASGAVANSIAAP
jgi:hypothetical protein